LRLVFFVIVRSSLPRSGRLSNQAAGPKNWVHFRTPQGDAIG
jgi:hypothetical protein